MTHGGNIISVETQLHKALLLLSHHANGAEGRAVLSPLQRTHNGDVLPWAFSREGPLLSGRNLSRLTTEEKPSEQASESADPFGIRTLSIPLNTLRQDVRFL